MGQSLSEPNTEKESDEYVTADFMVGCCSMQGWRPQMEDAHSVQLPLCPSDASSAYFAVFDGHGGTHFSTHCGKELHKVLVENCHFEEGNYELALTASFHALDAAMQKDVSEPGGTTAIVVMIKDGYIFCANVGDSRAIASVGGKVVELSHDHKPLLPAEQSRIYKGGGWVEFNRVNGVLALSRAFGDFEFKRNSDLKLEEQVVTADPEVTSFSLEADCEFLVLACDGIWDVMSNEEVLQFVRKRIAERMKPVEICEVLLDHCLAPDCRMGGVGCDNMTIILVCFLHNAPYSQLCEKCCSSSSSASSENTPTSPGSITFFKDSQLPSAEPHQEEEHSEYSETSESASTAAPPLPSPPTSDELDDTLSDISTLL